jgi:hypothetical protein
MLLSRGGWFCFVGCVGSGTISSKKRRGGRRRASPRSSSLARPSTPPFSLPLSHRESLAHTFVLRPSSRGTQIPQRPQRRAALWHSARARSPDRRPLSPPSLLSPRPRRPSLAQGPTAPAPPPPDSDASPSCQAVRLVAGRGSVLVGREGGRGDRVATAPLPSRLSSFFPPRLLDRRPKAAAARPDRAPQPGWTARTRPLHRDRCRPVGLWSGTGRVRERSEARSGEEEKRAAAAGRAPAPPPPRRRRRRRCRRPPAHPPLPPLPQTPSTLDKPQSNPFVQP